MLFLTLFLFGCEEAPDPSEILSNSCQDNDPDACFTLGTQELNAPRPDYAEARRLFSMGCGVHHASSCNALGTLVRDARGGPKDMRRSANLFKVACEKGVAQACVHHAELLAKGTGVEQDEAAAAKLYAQACETDSPIPKACTELGIFLRDAKGVDRDKDKAVALFTAACDAGYAPGCVELANGLTQKWGKDNMIIAAGLLDKACGIDANFGCFELAELHRTKKAPDANIEQAGHYYNSICRIDPSRGCFELAELMSTEEVPSRPGEKEALYKLACESGNSDACYKR